MRFPANIYAVQHIGDGKLAIAFFQDSNGDMRAVRGFESWAASDFASLMEVVLPLGACEFHVPTKLHSQSLRSIGLLRLIMSARLVTGTTSVVAYDVQGGVDGVDLASSSDACLLTAIEKAVGQLITENGVVPARCICCQYSDYEAHTTFGNLRCYVGEKQAYCAAAEAMQSDPAARYTIFNLPSNATDELGTCAEFAARPPRWGYRG